LRKLKYLVYFFHDRLILGSDGKYPAGFLAWKISACQKHQKAYEKTPAKGKPPITANNPLNSELFGLSE